MIRFKKIIHTAILILSLVFCVTQLSAQSDTLHYFPPMHNDFDGAEEQYLYIATSDPGPVNVTVTDGAGNVILGPQAITPATPIELNVEFGGATEDNTVMFTQDNELSAVLSGKGIIVTSDKNTTASFRIIDGLQGDILTSKGAGGAMGTVFRAGAEISQSNSGNDNFFVSVMATEDATTLNISDLPAGLILNANGATFDPGGSIGPITLNKGQSYVISGNMSDDGGTDINRDGILGALIEADKKIVVTNGNLASIGRDFFIDQSVPVNKLGRDHILIRGNASNGNSDQEKGIVIATEDNTVIKVNGLDPLVNGTRTPTTINAGDYFVIDEENYVPGGNGDHENMVVQTNNPIYMYQTMLGDAGTTGGLLLIPPFNCYQPRQINIPQSNDIGPNENYNAELMIFTEAGSILTINGVTQTNVETVPGGVGYETYKIPNLTGNLDVRSTGPMAASLFGASGAIGIGGAYSGFIIPDTTKMFYVDTCYGSRTRFTTTHNLDETILGYNWNFGDPASGANNTFVSNDVLIDTASHVYSATGAYTTTLIVTRNTCNDTVVRTLNIIGLDAGISGGDTVCQNDPQPVITFTTTVGVAPYNFVYNINGANTQTITVNNPTTTVNAPTAASGKFVYNFVNVTDSSPPVAGACPFAPDSAIVVVNGIPSATIAGDAAACQNAATPTVTLTGSNASPPYTFVYNINNATTYTLSTTTTDDTVVLAPTGVVGTFAYNLERVTVSGGCTQATPAVATVTVNPAPTATITGTSTVCATPGTTDITFTGTGTTPFTFSYIDATGAAQTVVSSGTSTVVTQSTAVAGAFTYSLTNVSDATGCGQAQSGAATVTVNELPTGSLGNDTLVCTGALNTNVLFRGTGGAPPYIFTYTIDGAPQPTVSTAPGESTLSVAANTGAASTYTYALVSVQDANICSQAAVDVATVEVKAPSTGTISSSAYRVCMGDPSPTITLTGANGTAPYTFDYSLNNLRTGITSHTVGTTAGSSTTSFTVSTLAADTLIYTLTGVADNSGLTCGAVGSFDTLIIDPNPISTITASLNDVCIGAPDQVIKFDATGVAGVNPPVTFNYFINENNTGDVAQPPLVSAPGTYSTTLMASANTLGTTVWTNGASSSAFCSGGSGIGSARLTVNPLPDGSIGLGSASPICENTTGAVTFTGTIGTPPYTFTYNIDGGATQTVTSASGQSTVNVVVDTLPGTYTYNLLSVRDTFNCTPTVQPTGSVNITIDPLPTATAGGVASICANTTHTLTGVTTSNGTISWLEDGVGSITAGGTTNSPEYTPDNADAGNAVTLDLTVTGLSACNAETATASYTINVNGLPTATIAGSTTICQGSGSPSVTLTGANGTGPYIFTYTENGVTNTANSTGATALLPLSDASAATYTHALVSVEDANGCSQAQTGNTIVRVNPTASGSISGGTTVCQNTASALTLTGSNGDAPYTFTYSIDGQAPITVNTAGIDNTVSINVPTNNDGTYNYTLLSVEDVNNGGCGNVATAAASVTVDSLPLAVAGVSSNTICVNETATVSGASFRNGTVSWSHDGNGSLSDSTSPSPSYKAAAGDNTVTLTMLVTSDNTCSPQTATATYVVNVNALPVGTVSGDATVCEGDADPIVTFSSSAGQTPFTYYYTVNGGNVQSLPVGTSTLTPGTSISGSNQYVLQSVVDGNGCTSLPPGGTSVATVVVNSNPVGSLVVKPAVCQNSAALLEFTASGGSANYTFTYTINGGASKTVSTISNNSTAIVGANTSTPRRMDYNLLLVSDANGCSTTHATLDTLLVNPLPQATINGGGNICQDSVAADIIVTGYDGSSPYTVVYKLDGIEASPVQLNAVSNAFNIQVLTNTAGTRTYDLVKVIDANGCEQKQTGSISVNVYENPLPDFYVDPKNATVLEPVINIYENSLEATAWNWGFGDGTTSNSPDPQAHEYKDSGSYEIRLVVTNALGCVDSIIRNVNVSVPLSVYVPNSFTPNADGLNDVFLPKGEGINDYSLKIYDRWGNMVFISDDIEIGWDGIVDGGTEIAQQDVFVYVVEVSSVATSKTYVYRGTFELIK